MKELQAILDRVMNPETNPETNLETNLETNPGMNPGMNIPDRPSDFALATLVKTMGSSYRRSGARMLVTATGECIGTLSGGCLEHDVAEQAQEVLRSHIPRLVTYDTTAQDDIIWGLGLGCNGVIQILIESLDLQSPFHALRLLQQGLQTQRSSVLVSVFRVEQTKEIAVGARLLLDATGRVISNISHAQLQEMAIADAQKALQGDRSSTRQYALETGVVEALIEVVKPAVPLVIFGAGHDAVPIAHLAKLLGWQVTVVDCRAREATRERFAFVDRVVLARPETFQEQVTVTDQTMAVLVNHHYLDDLEILTQLFQSPVRYIGCLGAKSRRDRLLNELSPNGIPLTSQQLQRFYAPVGLEIGADTPETIALAIVAEIQKCLTESSGQSLRDRAHAIHPLFDPSRLQIHSSI
ncbi:MAG: XdhC family protein [Oculatellaceae cyanobacterium Prado106]|jgi:xanthine/CO dehydrogenase XdhC/CoxF family maturation factor|nr:XdhC family protein [Oculatellaceae cyanobacterium Prado106]